MLRRRRRAGVGAGVGHPAGDLAVLPAEPCGAGAQALARRGSAGRAAVCTLSSASTSSQICVQLVDVEIVEAVVVAPAPQHVLGWAPVQPGVDLRPAADAAPLGVGERRAAEGGGDAAGAVLAVHLLERERDDLALADELALLDDDDVEAGLGEQGRRRASAGAGPDDEHVGWPLGGRRSWPAGGGVVNEALRRRPSPARSPTRRRRPGSGRAGRSRRAPAAAAGEEAGDACVARRAAAGAGDGQGDDGDPEPHRGGQRGDPAPGEGHRLAAALGRQAGQVDDEEPVG